MLNVTDIITFFFLLVSRKTSQAKKNQDFGNIFSFPSYSQKTDDGELVFTVPFNFIATIIGVFWGVVHTNFT